MIREYLALFGQWPRRSAPVLSGKRWPGAGREAWEAASPEAAAYRLRVKGDWDAAALLDDRGLLDAAARLEADLRVTGWSPVAAPSQLMPSRLCTKLGNACPPLFWLRGNAEGLAVPGVGIVGGRLLSSQEAMFASEAGKACVRAGLTVFSGGASGADSFGAAGALLEGGRAFHFLPGGAVSSEAPVLCRDPNAPPFDRLEALSRNRWVYASSEAVVLVSSRLGEGGSWAGAISARRSRLTRLIVYLGSRPSPGNEALARMGVESVSSASEFEELLAGIARPVGLAI